MKKNNKGFTLAELLIVVAIIGVLVAISIPIFARQKLKAQEAVDKANLRAAYAEVMAAAASDPDHSWYVPVKMTHKGNYGVNNARQFYLVSSDETIAGISTAGINHPNEGTDNTLFVVLYTSEQAKKLAEHKGAYGHYYFLLLGRQYPGANSDDERWVENPVVVVAQGVPDNTGIDFDIEEVK